MGEQDSGMSLQIVECPNPKCKHKFPTTRQGKFQCGKCGRKWKVSKK